MVDELFDCKGTRAESAVVIGMVRVPFHFDKLAILDVHKYPAPSVTPGTRGPCYSFYNFIVIFTLFHHTFSFQPTLHSSAPKGLLKQGEGILLGDISAVHRKKSLPHCIGPDS